MSIANLRDIRESQLDMGYCYIGDVNINGKSYKIYDKTIELKCTSQFWEFCRALILTVFTLGLALIDSRTRHLWNKVFSGKSVKRIAISKNDAVEPIQNHHSGHCKRVGDAYRMVNQQNIEVQVNGNGLKFWISGNSNESLTLPAPFLDKLQGGAYFICRITSPRGLHFLDSSYEQFKKEHIGQKIHLILCKYMNEKATEDVTFDNDEKLRGVKVYKETFSYNKENMMHTTGLNVKRFENLAKEEFWQQF